MKINSKTISYATMEKKTCGWKKKRVDEEKEKDLQDSIQRLETKINLTEDENKNEARTKQTGFCCN